MDRQKAKFGFTQFAETWSGRLAMMGFTLSIIAELVTGHGLYNHLLAL